MKKGSIDEDKVPQPMSFTVIELTYEDCTILEIHSAEPMRLNFLLRIIKILHNSVNPGRYHCRSAVCWRCGKAQHGKVDIRIDAAILSKKAQAV